MFVECRIFTGNYVNSMLGIWMEGLSNLVLGIQTEIWDLIT
jgi:hypothetical protein